MRALKIVSALLMVALSIMTMPLMLADVLNSYCDHKGLSFAVWMVIAAITVGLVHIALRSFTIVAPQAEIPPKP